MISLGQIIEYAPEDQQEILFNEFFDFLYSYIQEAKDVAIVKEIVQILIDSAYKKENIDILITWLKAGQVLNPNGEKIANTNLTQNQKYSIGRKVWADPEFSLHFKGEIQDLVVGDNKDDHAKLFKLACESLNPAVEAKAKVWEKITDFKAVFSSYERNTLWSGFFS